MVIYREFIKAQSVALANGRDDDWFYHPTERVGGGYVIRIYDEAGEFVGLL